MLNGMNEIKSYKYTSEYNSKKKKFAIKFHKHYFSRKKFPPTSRSILFKTLFLSNSFLSVHNFNGDNSYII